MFQFQSKNEGAYIKRKVLSLIGLVLVIFLLVACGSGTANISVVETSEQIAESKQEVQGESEKSQEDDSYEQKVFDPQLLIGE